jgi:hypothetical protein
MAWDRSPMPCGRRSPLRRCPPLFRAEGQPCNRERQRLFLPRLPPGSDETSSGRGSEGRGQVLSLGSHGALRSAPERFLQPVLPASSQGLRHD